MTSIPLPFTGLELVPHAPMSLPSRDGQPSMTASWRERASNEGWLPLRVKPADRHPRRLAHVNPDGSLRPATLATTPSRMMAAVPGIPVPVAAAGELRPPPAVQPVPSPTLLANVGANAARLSALLQEKRQCGWVAATTQQERLLHKRDHVLGARSDIDKAGEFVDAVVNGTGEMAPPVTALLGQGWTRYSRRLGNGIATLDVRIDHLNHITDVRAPSEFPAAHAGVQTWQHPSHYRSSAADRMALRSAFLDMVVSLQGTAPIGGRTPRQHAEQAWTNAVATARASEQVDARYARIPLEDRIAVALFARRERYINAALTGNDAAAMARVAPFARVLTSGLNQLPLQAAAQPLYASLTIANAHDKAAFLAGFHEGRTMVDPRFLAASPAQAQGRDDFQENIFFSIVGHIGARPLGALAPAGDARATHVYPSGTQFQVSDRRDTHLVTGSHHAVILLDQGQTCGPLATRR